MTAVPVLSFGVVQLANTASAGASGSKTTTCGGGSQTVTFAAPGISEKGTASAVAKSISNTTSSSITCIGKHPGSGTLAANKIKTKSTLTCATDTSPPSPCPSGDFVYDSAGQFAGGASTLYKGVKTTTWTIGSTTYTAANTSSAQATSTQCPSTEAGFVLSGHLTAPASQSGAATTITACLNGDTGTNTTGNLKNDVTSEVLGNASIVITSASFDPASSSISFQ